MPFVFFCSQCGTVLYEDPSPMLQDGSYKSPTYLESILTKTGINCPTCGHELHVPPSSIEVFAPATDRHHKKNETKKPENANHKKSPSLKVDHPILKHGRHVEPKIKPAE
jgi:DNA-directed RNA polymerase subunit RPC12/RpoP